MDKGELMVDELKSKLGMSKLLTLLFIIVNIMLAIFTNSIYSI